MKERNHADRHKLEQAFGRKMSAEELAEFLGVDVK